MKVFIAGSNGQLGRELSRQLTACGFAYAGYDMPEIDITDVQICEKLIRDSKADIIVNCAAMTNVDGCETNREGAFAANAQGPENLAKIAAKLNIPLVHISTDYVFDGKGIEENGMVRPYIETDAIDPQTVYGESKAAGEKAVMTYAPKYFIIRTAWLYGDGHNFVKTMLNLAQTRKELTVVDDQIGSPTCTVDLAKAIIALIQTEAYGIYHGTCEGCCSWCDFAKKIFELSDIEMNVRPVTSEEYASPTPRPKYSVLENKGLKELGIDVFRPWEEDLVEYLQWLKTTAV